MLINNIKTNYKTCEWIKGVVFSIIHSTFPAIILIKR